MLQADDQTKEMLQTKVNNLIKERQQNAKTAFDRIMEEGNEMRDFIVPVPRLKFDANGVLYMGFDENQFTMHRNALGQISERNNIPVRYMQNLQKTEWGRALSAQILNTHTDNTNRERVLVRNVSDQVRGVLSDKYRRLNSMRLYQTFLQHGRDFDGVVIDAHAADTRGYIEIVRPHIEEIPTKNNGTVHMVFGARMRNSDFGDGALELKFYTMQAVCLNGMVTETALREIHLGDKLPDNLNLSEETYRLDTERAVSIAKDAMNQLFSRENYLKEISRIQKASEMQLDLQKQLKELPKVGVTESESKRIEEVLIRNDPNDGVQGNASLWKFAQAIGAVARDVEQPVRKRELEDISGKLISSKVNLS